MPQPQPGIILAPSEHARFVIFRVSEIKKSARIMAKCVGSIPALTAHISRVVIEENGEAKGLSAINSARPPPAVDAPQ